MGVKGQPEQLDDAVCIGSLRKDVKGVTGTRVDGVVTGGGATHCVMVSGARTAFACRRVFASAARSRLHRSGTMT